MMQFLITPIKKTQFYKEHRERVLLDQLINKYQPQYFQRLDIELQYEVCGFWTAVRLARKQWLQKQQSSKFFLSLSPM